ncbi:MAG: cytochrome b/b6 domain-containing protein [Novosphingobium sp.]|nr:cytochrome b/b6 domain-containing protein [Novosphingobium sp.]
MADAPQSELPTGGTLVRRHRFATRLWHWVNALTVLVMLMSGLMIFNAHPRLYWGRYGANFDRPWLQIEARGGKGELVIGRHALNATGVLGVSRGPDGAWHEAPFPSWATIPSHYSLADARLWHFAFAWVLVLGLLAYLVVSLVNGHIRRDLHITRGEWSPRHIWHDIGEHARLRFPTGAAALKYNVLQKFAYGAVLFLLLPLVILTGMTMSPGLDAAFPGLLTIFGGRQSARSLHFLAAFGLVAFFVVHIVMVVLAGPLNEVRAMVTGWYRLPKERT